MDGIKHWPGKLSAHGPDKYGDIKLCGETNNGFWVAFANYYTGEPAVTHDDGSPMSRADWLDLMEGTNERVAACWNALAGVPDEHLPTLMQEVREVLGELQADLQGYAAEHVGEDYNNPRLNVLLAKLTPKEPA